MKVRINGRKYGEFNEEVSKMEIEEQVHHFMFDEFEAEPILKIWKKELKEEGTMFLDGYCKEYQVRLTADNELEISTKRV